MILNSNIEKFSETIVAPKRMSSGSYVDLGNFNATDVDLFDINRALNLIYRFTGHYKDRKPLTVAQHTLLVYTIAQQFYPDEPAVLLDCVIHDFSEAYTGDIATPLKRMFGAEFRQYEASIEHAVYRRLWVGNTPFDEEIKSKRKVCDLISLDIERRAMWNSQHGKALWPDTPAVPYSLATKIKMFAAVQGMGDVDLVGLYDAVRPSAVANG